MKESNSQLKKKIMRRVYARWFTSRVAPILVAEGGGFVYIIGQMQDHMSFGTVMHNIMIRLGSYSPMVFQRYVVEAFYRAEVVSTLLLFGALVVGVLFVRDFLRFSRGIGVRNFLRLHRVFQYRKVVV